MDISIDQYKSSWYSNLRRFDNISCKNNDCEKNNIVNAFELALKYIHFLWNKNNNNKYDLDANGYATTINPLKITYLSSESDKQPEPLPVYKLWEKNSQYAGHSDSDQYYYYKYIKYKSKYLNMRKN